jgi:hypothetical protein
LESLLSPDEPRARARFLSGFDPHSSAPLRPDLLGDPDGYLFVLNDLRDRPEAFSILMPEKGRIERLWHVVTKVNVVLLAQDGIVEADKLAIGRAFLQVLGEDDLVEVAGRDLASLALEVQSRVKSVEEARELRALLGESFLEVQARRVVSAFRGLVSWQFRLDQLARSLVGARLKPHEEAAASEAFQRAVAEKREVLAGILAPQQLAALYDDHGYDSIEYWRDRLRSE